MLYNPVTMHCGGAHTAPAARPGEARSPKLVLDIMFKADEQLPSLDDTPEHRFAPLPRRGEPLSVWAEGWRLAGA